MISLLVSMFCAYCAYSCFSKGSEVFGWLNLTISAFNFANFMIVIGL
jgi:hypothetical protein